MQQARRSIADMSWDQLIEYALSCSAISPAVLSAIDKAMRRELRQGTVSYSKLVEDISILPLPDAIREHLKLMLELEHKHGTSPT